MAEERTRASGGNLAMVGKLVVVAAVMFGFGFAMVPIYRAICDVTGVNFLTRPDEERTKVASTGKVDKDRLVTIEFDANSRGDWGFKPEVRSLTAHPGELVTVTYEIANNLPRKLSGQAIPSYAPQLAVKYFHKLECFCFAQQDFAAQEKRRFPVVFVIDPELPRDVQTITLSYTFFEIEGKKSLEELRG